MVEGEGWNFTEEVMCSYHFLPVQRILSLQQSLAKVTAESKRTNTRTVSHISYIQHSDRLL